MLAGVSYLDLLDTYDVYYSTVFKSFHECIKWVLKTFIFPLDTFVKTKNWEGLNTISEGFARFTQGILSGIIGAIDGLAVRIRAPSPTRDGVEDPGNCYCRKGFHALNVQAICDSCKRFLWASTGHKGSTHDCSAWHETDMHTNMKDLSHWLEEQGFVLIGDSAYNLLSYFLVPYDNAAAGTPEDAYNFWHSNARIRIECAFGELVMRWGIFWRTMRFDLVQVGNVVQAAMLLHNFLIDERADDEEDADYFRNFCSACMNEQYNRSSEASELVITDCNINRPPGRLDREETELREKGETRRFLLMTELRSAGMVRQLQNYKLNHFGVPYMAY
jgi:hypothetical protein